MLRPEVEKEMYAMEMFCPKCGKGLQDDARFCDGCGMSVSHITGPSMNSRQRRILIVVAVAVVVMMLFPPFYFPREGATSVRHDYGWLLSSGYGRVEVELLVVQFLAVGVIGLIAYVLSATKNR